MHEQIEKENKKIAWKLSSPRKDKGECRNQRQISYLGYLVGRRLDLFL
jgi:hypothetical protein